MRIALYFCLSSLVCWWLWRYSRPLAVATKKALACTLMFIGLAMAMAIGTATHLALPGVGSIGVSAAVGAIVGWLTWLVVGTLGVVPLGIAVGLWGMVSAAAGFSVLGGLVGGIGFKTVLTPYVPIAIWLPLIFTAFVIRKDARKARLKKSFENNLGSTHS